MPRDYTCISRFKKQTKNSFKISFGNPACDHKKVEIDSINETNQWQPIILYFFAISSFPPPCNFVRTGSPGRSTSRDFINSVLITPFFQDWLRHFGEKRSPKIRHRMLTFQSCVASCLRATSKSMHINDIA